MSPPVEPVEPDARARADRRLPPPAEVLPHRPPFLFLDEVTELHAGQARGRWRPAVDAPMFEGHFPGRPTLPGVLMIEALAQLGAYAVLLDERVPSGSLPLFGGIDGARFRRQVVPGETLDLEVELGRLSARAGRGRGRVTVDGQRTCEADLLFVIANPEGAE